MTGQGGREGIRKGGREGKGRGEGESGRIYVCVHILLSLSFLRLWFLFL